MIKGLLLRLIGLPSLILTLSAFASFAFYNETSQTFSVRETEYAKLLEDNRLLLDLHGKEPFLTALAKTFAAVDTVQAVQDCLAYFSSRSDNSQGLFLLSSRTTDPATPLPSLGAISLTLKCRSKPLCRLLVEAMNRYPNLSPGQWELAPDPGHQVLLFSGTLNLLKLNSTAP